MPELSLLGSLAALAHASLPLLWASTLCFRGAHFSNFVLWSRNAFESSPAGNVPTPLLGQAFLNAADDGQYLLAGTCFLWRSLGVGTRAALKRLALLGISLFLLTLALSCVDGTRSSASHTLGSSRTSKALISSGLGLLWWGGHLPHVCLPQQSMIAAGIDHRCPTLALARCTHVREFAGAYDGAVSTGLIPFHHLSIGTLCLLVAGYASSAPAILGSLWTLTACGSSLLTLAIASGSMGSLSTALSFALLFAPSYGPVASAYATVWALFGHHYWVGILSLPGAASHLALFAVRARSALAVLFSHRDTLLGHLTWARTFVGAHSVGALIHNDSMEALARNHDTFSDASIQVRPMLAVLAASPALSSADFLVLHAECFCVHTAVLVLLKGLLLARSSRLVPDKGLLGFTYPCDGPGRGGTCQISPSDHGFLGAFWAYNTGSLGPFHSFWYAQAVLWGQLDDWAVSATSINGWLRSLLWTQSAKVIQAYGTPFSHHSLVFFTGHFVWAFSLMFLFTGRGYWQELVESVAWAHLKLQLVPTIQPRALSITTGRAVGCTHYLAGGVAASWAFSTCRFVS